MAKQKQTFEQHWRARHERALDAAHRRLLAGLCDPEWSKLDQDDLYSAAHVYEKAMGIREFDEDADDGLINRWMDVFGKAWRREVRQKGTALVVCDAFDVALRAALLATGEPWLEETAAAGKVTPISSRRRAA